MQIAAFFICDSAKDYHGRLSILGMMEQITSETFPFQHQEMTVVLRFVFTEQDRGSHELVLRFIDGDGNSPLADGGPKIKFEVPSIPTERVYWTLNQCFQLVGVPFRAPGLYRFDLIVDGQQRAFAPLRVEKKIKSASR